MSHERDYEQHAGPIARRRRCGRCRTGARGIWSAWRGGLERCRDRRRIWHCRADAGPDAYDIAALDRHSGVLSLMALAQLAR